MRLVIHAEIKDVEQPLVYEGESLMDALTFANEVFTHEPRHVQCNMMAEVNGEQRALARVARTPEAAELLLRDAMAWITEVDPSLLPAR